MMSRSMLALLATALALAPSALATDGYARNLAKLPGPFTRNKTNPYMTVLYTSLTIDNEKSSMNATRMIDGQPARLVAVVGQEGVPNLRADYDSAVVTVKVTGTPVANAVSTSVYACYAKGSLYDRGWRKPSNNTELDKQCPWLIKADMPVTGGSTQWTPQADIPLSLIFLRAYQMCSLPGDEEHVICAFGESPGIVQINPVQTHPHNLVGAAIACMFAGPLCLLGWYIYESKVKKEH